MESPRFSIQRGHSGREVMAIVTSADWLGATVVWEVEASPGTIPIGTVEFCESEFGPHQIDFYPEFLRHMLHRSMLRTGGGMLYAPRFLKDANAWKSDFESGVRPSGTIIPKGWFWVSEPVSFTNEWRYYVAEGSVITTGWYAGTDEDLPAPDCGVSWPEDFSGAVDFGTLPNGTLALVEAHAPFACGWYGDDHKDYALWQAMAWESRSWW